MVDTENVIIVSGAGASEVNGVYIYAGQSYEKPGYLINTILKYHSHGL